MTQTTSTHTAPAGRQLSAYDKASRDPELAPLLDQLDRLCSMERRIQMLADRSTSPDVPQLGPDAVAAAEFALTDWADFA